MDLLVKYLPLKSKVLDLGGGAGKYSIELAKRGFRVTLADLSVELLSKARKEIESQSLNSIESIDEVNTIDLSIYQESSFEPECDGV